MIEIRHECSNFQITSQRHDDQVRIIIKKGWFSNLETIGIHLEINNQQGNNTISDTPSINQQKMSSQNELPISQKKETVVF